MSDIGSKRLLGDTYIEEIFTVVESEIKPKFEQISKLLKIYLNKLNDLVSQYVNLIKDVERQIARVSNTKIRLTKLIFIQNIFLKLNNIAKANIASIEKLQQNIQIEINRVQSFLAQLSNYLEILEKNIESLNKYFSSIDINNVNFTELQAYKNQLDEVLVSFRKIFYEFNEEFNLLLSKFYNARKSFPSLRQLLIRAINRLVRKTTRKVTSSLVSKALLNSLLIILPAILPILLIILLICIVLVLVIVIYQSTFAGGPLEQVLSPEQMVEFFDNNKDLLESTLVK
ncbi:MAG: hypothetical protein NZZ41_05730 [Candidatus Dojkabacteria bacterium]|nr:hypothetical protein [Candidatus Dojkabacteria bacterium]